MNPYAVSPKPPTPADRAGLTSLRSKVASCYAAAWLFKKPVKPAAQPPGAH